MRIGGAGHVHALLSGSDLTDQGRLGQTQLARSGRQ